MPHVAPRLLLVEDDDHIRTSLRWALEDDGYQVSEAPTGESALAQVAVQAPDLMIVDLMLGTMDGFAVIREVRRHHDLPVIVISARADSHDIITALESGADDYVTKPFEVREVTARLRALRRRSTAAGNGQAAVGPSTVVLDRDPARALVLTPDAGSLTRGGEPVPLTVTEFRLLAELATAPGRVFSRALLLERVWDRGFFGDERIVDVHVRRLRTKVESDPARPRVVVTVRGLGYRLDTR